MATATPKSPTRRKWFDLLDHLLGCDYLPDQAHRILLHGPPGTGKSSYFAARFNGEVERITLDSATPSDDLLGTVQLQGDGKGGTVTQWADGPAIRAMKTGRPLILDEVDKASDDVQTILHAVMDDLTIAAVTLPNGETVKPAPGFIVVATMNGHPSSLNEAMLNRFELVLLADQPAPEAIASLPNALRSAVERTYATNPEAAQHWVSALTVRTAHAFYKLSLATSPHEAAQIIFGPNGRDLADSLAIHQGSTPKSKK